MKDKDIEEIVKIANTDKCLNSCEPQVVYHGTIHCGQVRRILYAMKVYEYRRKK